MIRCLKNFLATQNIYVSVAHTKKKIDKYLEYIEIVFQKISKKNK